MASKASGKPATRADVQAVENNVNAVQSDVKALRTDVQAVETKVTAVRTELKAEIKKVDQKVDDLSGRVDVLSKVTNNTAVELVRTQGEMAKMEQRLQTQIRAESNRVVTLLDTVLSKLETYDRESVGIPNALDEHGRTLKNHEGRIGALEKARS